ncbi:MAG TPA: PAS domain S-box protein [Candidatus Sulfomarinibacteraceae bacterium]|nr:PAS domain S-box protein [Candidatus Sulfomarinibacteraceae bacterium]
MTGLEIDPRLETRAALSDLLDRLAFVGLTVGVASALIGLLRITSQGWHTNVITDLGFFVLMIAVLLLRRRLPVGLVVSTLTALVAGTAVASFLTLGLGTVSFVGLTACCMVLGVLYGSRVGFVFLAGSILVVTVIGWAVCTGRLTGLRVSDPYLLQPQTWATQIAGFAAYTAVILVVGGALQERLSSSLRAVSRQAEELRASEERYRLLADNMTDVLFTQDMHLRVTYVSPSVEKLTGYTPDEVRELTMADLLTPDSLTRALETFGHFAALAEEREVEIPPLEFEYVRKDGTTFWGEMTPAFITDDEGRPTGSQGLLRDVTRRKQIERERGELELELRQADKLRAIGQLAGGIAHDFNNQLAPIMAHADLLARGLASPDSAADHARKILGPARNAADLTAKLLAFARKGSYEITSVDLHEVINEVVEILVHGIDRRIRLKRLYEADTAVVEGDRTQLQNVMLNLALNARDALPEGGEIVVSTRNLPKEPADDAGSEKWLEVTVADNGLGMDPEVRQRAFEPFFTTKAPGKGTGMGLAAAYGTVTGHGGRIGIESRPGAGTEVSIRLPVSRREATPKVDTLAEILAPGVGRALVVDDDEGVRTAICELLEALGFTVEAHDRGARAAADYAERWRDVDLVVLDLVLPDMTGREALEAIREVNPEARVLLVSGYTADDSIRELVHGGRVEFLEKPFLLADLAERLTRLMGSR